MIFNENLLNPPVVLPVGTYQGDIAIREWFASFLVIDTFSQCFKPVTLELSCQPGKFPPHRTPSGFNKFLFNIKID